MLRDAQGYVRGYGQYLSFDLPLAWRLLVLRRPAFVIVEPPPTTGLVVRTVCAFRRIPYVYFAADLWSDALGSTTTPRFVRSVVRAMERAAIRGAQLVFSVSDDVTERLAEWGFTSGVTTVGNGVDVSEFGPTGDVVDLGVPYLLYAGTASEVHGAAIFVEAFGQVLKEFPSATLVFIGQGADRAVLEQAAAELPPGSVRFEPRVSSAEVACWIRGAAATLASVHPEGYVRAFPTKMYASVACGTRVIYAGAGPGAPFARDNGVGWAAAYEAREVADAMRQALSTPQSAEDRQRIARWAQATLSLDAVAGRAVAALRADTRLAEHLSTGAPE